MSVIVVYVASAPYFVCCHVVVLSPTKEITITTVMLEKLVSIKGFELSLLSSIYPNSVSDIVHQLVPSLFIKYFIV